MRIVSVALSLLVLISSAVAEVSPFCEISVAEQPELGSPVAPGENSFIETVRVSWLGKNGALQESLSKFAIFDVVNEFKWIFGYSAIDTPRTANFLEFRMAYIPELAAFRRKYALPTMSEVLSFKESYGTFVEQADSLTQVNDAGLEKWFQAVHDELRFRTGRFGVTRNHYLLPGTFVNKRRLSDAGEELRVWSFDFRRSDYLARYLSTTAYKETQIAFEEWARILVAYGIIPITLTNILAYHDFFGHVMAAIVHPFEELVLQKRFYDRFVQGLDQVALDQRKAYSDIHFEAANIIFEDLELPKKTAFAQVSLWKKDKFKNAFEPFRKTGIRMISADALIAESKTEHSTLFSREVSQVLREFRERIVLRHEDFYASADFYGGDFYDVRNHLRKGNTVKNYVDERYGLSLEHLRFRALSCAEPICEPLIRLFAAYVNAAEHEINYEAMIEAATGPKRQKSKLGYRVPFLGSTVENYWRSYTGPGFIEEMDRWFEPHR